MSTSEPLALSAVSSPIRLGTWVQLDPGVTFFNPELIAGGAPWRLLRVPGTSSRLVESWRHGAVIEPGQDRFARTLVQQGLLHPRYESALDLDDVDVVIPVFDNAMGLEKLLNSLGALHVTVIDDGSSTAQEIAHVVAKHSAKLIRCDTNGGPARARNLGLAATTRPFVWFLDADVVLGTRSVELSRLLANFEDPLVAAVATRVIGAPGPSARDHFEQHHCPLDMGAVSGLVVPGSKISFVPSASLVVRRTATGSGFDETLRVGEDVNFAWQLHDRGWLVRYDATHKVEHTARDSWRGWVTQRIQYGRSASELARLHPERMAPLRADAWTLAAWGAIVARQPRMAGAVVDIARRSVREQLPDTITNRDDVANHIALQGIMRSGGPLARSLVRTYAPVVIVGVLSSRTRVASMALLGASTAWRWREQRTVHPRDIGLSLVDDVAYSLGVWAGALSQRNATAVTPKISLPRDGLKSLVSRQKLGQQLLRKVTRDAVI